MHIDKPSKPLFNVIENYHKHLIFDNPKLTNYSHDFIDKFDSWMSVRGCYYDKFWCYDDIELPENWEYSNTFNNITNPDNNNLFKLDNNLKSYSHSNRLREKEEDWATARLFLLSGQFLKDNANRDNMFLWIECAGMSDLWEAPAEIHKLYQQIGSNGKIDPRIFLIQNNLIKNQSSNIIDALVAAYYARITFIDRWIGILLKTITSIGIDENTAIVVTSMSGHKFPFDNLDSFNLLENTCHVPLIVKIPHASHQKDITPTSSTGIYHIIASINNDQSYSTSIAYQNQKGIIICAASSDNPDDFAVTDGIDFTHFNDIDLSLNNKISEYALKLINNRK